MSILNVTAEQTPIHRGKSEHSKAAAKLWQKATFYLCVKVTQPEAPSAKARISTSVMTCHPRQGSKQNNLSCRTDAFWPAQRTQPRTPDAPTVLGRAIMQCIEAAKTEIGNASGTNSRTCIGGTGSSSPSQWCTSSNLYRPW